MRRIYRTVRTHVCIRIFAIIIVAISTITVLPVLRHDLHINAESLQPAMWFMDDLNITQVPGGGFSHAGTNNFDVTGINNNNIKAPFDCTIVAIFPGYDSGNTVIIQSINPVLYANGTQKYMSMSFGHDENISDCYVGRTIKQGEVFYQTGAYGNVTGVHSHVLCIEGKYTDHPGWIKVSTGNYTFSHGLDPRDCLFLYPYTRVYDNKNMQFKTYSSDTTPPSISNVKITNKSSNGYDVTCTITDNVGVTRWEFPSWKVSRTSEGCKWYQGWRNGNTYGFTFSDADLEGDYLTHIYAWDAAGNRSSVSAPVVYVDKTKPVITDIKVTDVTSKGYKVSCKATDNRGVTRVQFPTWTSRNGQDDLFPNWPSDSKATGTRNGDTWTYEVKISDHNNESGNYLTHIYAYDDCGNYTAIYVPDVTVPGPDTIPPVIENVTFIEQTDDSVIIEADVKDNVGVTRIEPITMSVVNGKEKSFLARCEFSVELKGTKLRLTLTKRPRTENCILQITAYDANNNQTAVKVPFKTRAETYIYLDVGDTLNAADYFGINPIYYNDYSACGDVLEAKGDLTYKALKAGKATIVLLTAKGTSCVVEVIVTDPNQTGDNNNPSTPTSPSVTPGVQENVISDLAAVKVSKPKAAKKAVTVKWKKVSKKNQKKIQGVEIQVAADKNFKSVIKTTTAGKKKTSKKIKGLKAKKTYWVRIRAYKNAADGKHVSAWKVKKFKTK